MTWPTHEGQTPLTDEDRIGLLVPVATREDLDAVEAANIMQAVVWLARSGPRVPRACLEERFLDGLHRRMLGHVWRWAGTRRRRDTNIGSPWTQIATDLSQLRIELDGWLEYNMPPAEVAVRVGHRLVKVHLYPNGNGRHSRLVADHLATTLGLDVFTWGSTNLVTASQTRTGYLQALRAADEGDIAPLVDFAHS